ncbi:MAG TPA: mechanosensitive ion channel family protein [Gemmatimonadales bacterium]
MLLAAIAILQQRNIELFGVRLAAMNPETGRKLLLSLGFLAVLLVLSYVLRALLRGAMRGASHGRAEFWSRQAVQLLTGVILVLGLASIWFDDPGRLATVAGLATAGVAVALQRVITSFAAYLIVLRGRVYTIGDRITMGGVRGDVVALGFMQTTVMEMGEPPMVQSGEPPVWVTARQYTGRIVRITNDRIFDAPVFNYTREFPYLWEEIRLPVRYADDRHRAEAILLEAARRHTSSFAGHAAESLARLKDRFYLPETVALEPAVFYRLTDNWLELTLRFVVPEHGVRVIKDAMSREILAALDEAKIGIASATYEIVGVPTLRVEGAAAASDGSRDGG